MMTTVTGDTAAAKPLKSNLLGLDGIEFIEYAAPDASVLEQLFTRLGMTKVGHHKRKNVTLFRQGKINFVINKEPNTFAAEFANIHGPSICATGFRVKDAKKAFEMAVARGAKPIATENHPKSHSFPAIYGIGDSAVYFVDINQDGSHFNEDFDHLTKDPAPVGFGLEVIDHLTNNVPKGDMEKWCDFYSSIFDFSQVREFDIKGQATGLVSKVMRSPCGKITIPINEPTGEKSQIQEYLEEYRGSGIQHVALTSENIVASVTELIENGIEFLDAPPDTYYETVPSRVPNVTEEIGVLKKLAILCDGDEEGYLLQIFTKNMIGPIFFEIIQRRNHSGFGNGNFQALFDAIERDQKKRGYL